MIADSAALNGRDYSISLSGKVIDVRDGDTIIIKSKGHDYMIRLLGIDAPETKADFGVDQEYGAESTKWLKDKLLGKVVKILPSKVCVEKKKSCSDGYKRLLGTVILNGEDINLESVKAGKSHYLKFYENDYYPEMAKIYADAELTAKKLKLGLWSIDGPMNPYEFRKLQRKPRQPQIEKKVVPATSAR